MPIFHFDLVDGTVIEDAGRHKCRHLVEAKHVANGLAVRLLKTEPQLIGRGFAISVKTETNEEVYRAELDLLHKDLLSN